MAARTLSRVSARIASELLSTRDTVWCDTPATRATSRMLGDRGCCARVDAIATRSRSGPWHAHVHVHIPSQIIMHARDIGAT
ncbi:hypothetical protein GCM10017714_22510 [Curtobacterium pusillum]|nr:hypothetical protein GCM10017610_26690 [Curtobacterium pusillum]